MNNFFFKSKQSEPSSSSSPLPKPPHLILQQTLTDLQNHCSTFLHHNHHHHVLFNVPLFKPDNNNSNNKHACSFKTNLESTFSNLYNHAKQAIEGGLSSLSFGTGSSSSGKNPAWARVADKMSGLSVSGEATEERLACVPVYALSNSSQEFVLISGVNTGKYLGLFCFKEEDAEALLQQMKTMDPTMREGSKVVAVALNKVLQLKLDDVAFRFIPESTQIKNALKERRKAGFSDEGFSGVPVFQSRSLILKSQNKRYRPVFFRKEDLENSLLRAARQQKKLNPAYREGDIQVGVLEDIIQGMKDSNTSTWDDIFFIPPGFDVSTNPSQK